MSGVAYTAATTPTTISASATATSMATNAAGTCNIIAEALTGWTYYS